MKPGRLGVGIIGAGRVGPVLGAALAGAGHAIVGIDAAGDDARERAGALLPGVAFVDAATLAARSELVLLAVPTDQLAPLVAGLASAGAWQPGQIVVHTAAEYGTEVLQPASACGAIPIALHPALSFTGTSIDLSRLREATMAVTAGAIVLPIGQALAVEMGAEPVVVEEGDRPAYAAALAEASGAASRAVSQSLAELGRLGIEQPGRVLGAVVRSAVESELQNSPTGPDDL